ncbi:MAG TPA: hypothetical protein VFZ53_14085 [Polyangiaceae bacterium]
MSSRKPQKILWLTTLISTAALGAVTACGDDSDDDGGGSETGGSGGRGGSSGSNNGGSSGSTTGGTSGAAGEGGAGTGGSSGRGGTAGQGGTAGSATGGAGGEPGGAGGDDGLGGEGGGGGEPITYWPNGVTANGISATVDDRFHGVAVDGQNNVYAAGYLGEGVVTSGTTRQVVVAKYGSNGQLVNGFGAQGLALADLSTYAGLPDDTTTTASDPDPSQETARDVALQSDGKIVVAGVVERLGGTPDRNTPLDIFVMRFDTAGVRDNTFNAAGTIPGLQILNPNANSTNPLVYGISIDSTNRIYVFAHGNATHATRTDQDRYVYRLNADGTLDGNFGPGGFYTFDTPTLALNDNVRRGAVLANGTVVISGYTNVAGRNQIVLARATTAGIADATFSGDGIVRLAPFPLGMAECYGVAVQSDGSIVTTGYGNVDTERGTTSNFLDMVSFRVRANGTVDSTWAGNGGLAYDVNSGEDRGRAIMALADDRILVAGGGSPTATDKDPLLLLLDEDGLVAEDFDPSGRKLYGAFGSTGDEFYALARTPGSAGVVAAAGYAPTGGSVTNGNGLLAILPIPAN